MSDETPKAAPDALREFLERHVERGSLRTASIELQARVLSALALDGIARALARIETVLTNPTVTTELRPLPWDDEPSVRSRPQDEPVE